MRDARGMVVVSEEMAAGLERAVEAAGNRTRMAIALGLNPSSVSRWTKVPAERILDIEKLFGVPRATLRPDLFGDGA